MDNPHKRPATVGLIAGFAIVFAGAVAVYLDGKTLEISKWALIFPPGLLIGAWGASNLAQFRGYPSVIAYLLFAAGLGVVGLIAASDLRHAIGFGCILALVLPVSVILALPTKPWHLSK
jgi:hypothetical protein